MRPGQVLDMQADLLSRFEDHRFRKVVRNWFMLDFGGSTPDDTPSQRAQLEAAGDGLTEAMHNHVRAAYAYRVTEDMSHLVQHAATALSDEDTFDASLPPTGCGIVRFDRPLPIMDVRGRMMWGHWLTWGPALVNGQTVTLTTWFNDLATPDEVALSDRARREAYEFTTPKQKARYEEFAQEVLGRWGWNGADIAVHGADLGSEIREPNPEHAAKIIAEGDVPGPTTSTIRYAVALWMLLDQTITDVREEPIDRNTRRRMGRMNIPARVTVIQLRRRANSGRAEGESLVEWHHRWIVRAYWRTQHYGPGNSLTKRILVHGHDKGPQDKPLVVSDKIYSLER